MELREARRSLGLRQLDVARAAGVSRSWVSKVELGQTVDVGIRTLSIFAAIVGLDLSVRTYPGPDPLREQGHHDLLARVHALLPPRAPWRTEVLLPIPGDQRAWDAMTELWALAVAIEAEMRLTDLQALERRLWRKVRDGRVERLILAIADTRHNRAVVRQLAGALRASFPLQGAAAVAAIRSDHDPGCHLLLLV
jgi:transcriptional regulator with XRE-family HTH domain